MIYKHIIISIFLDVSKNNVLASVLLYITTLINLAIYLF